MVVLQRSEVSRNRLLYFLTIILSVAALVAEVSLYSGATQPVQLSLVFLGVIALAAVAVSFMQLLASPRRSHALLLQTGDDYVVATNSIHEGFKLRFLRDVLGDTVAAMNDAERERWKFLESDGYYPTLYLRNPKKLLILRLCTMIFDDVFAVDRNNRWEHHDSSSTADPTFSKGEMPRLKAWKGV